MTAAGTTIAGRYRVLHQLGAGGMGSVWLARDTSLDRLVAVKSVRASLGTDGTDGTDGTGGSAAGGGTSPGFSVGEQRAMREARLIARINHSHAVAIYDVVTHERQPWLVMEYVPSRNLSELVRERGPLDPRRAGEIGAQVASALVDAHRAGIVHRDVKPANVLIAEDGSAKITDFGIARGLDDVTLTATGAMWGTPAYFAPEVASGSPPTEKADVWSLGATLFFAVEGAPPYGTDGGALVLLGRIAHQPVPPPTRAGSLAPVLARLLDRDPHSRPSMSEAARLLGVHRPWQDDTRVMAGFGPPPVGPGPADDDQPTDEHAPAEESDPDDAADRTTRNRPALPPATDYAAADRAERRRRAGMLAVVVLAVLLTAVGLSWLAGNGGERSAAQRSPGPAASPGTGAGPSTAPDRRSTTAPEATSEGADRAGRAGGAGGPDQRRKPNRSRTRGATFSRSAMEQTVADYYAIMPSDTRTGFSLLGPGLRSQGFGSYDDFWDGIDSVDVSGLRAHPASHTVEGTVVFVTDDGRTSTERHRFGLVRDPSGDRLLVGSDTIIG